MVASKMASTVTVERACTGVFLGSIETCGWLPIMRIVNLKNPSYHYRHKTRYKQAEEENKMTKQMDLGGSFTPEGTSISLKRMGYGAIAVLREAVAAGVNHIDTSDYYGPHVTNEIIKRALHPYSDGPVIVTKLGARRGEDKSWLHAISRQELTDAVHDNLRNLGLDVLDIVNYRVMGSGHGTEEGSIAEQVTVLADLQRKGLIRHVGLSNVTAAQVAEAQ